MNGLPILTTVRFDLRRGDVETALADVQQVHGLVLWAALTGEPVRRVLWCHPEPDVLLIRHDRPMTVADFPRAWVRDLSARPDPPPAAGDTVDLVWVANPHRRKRIDGSRSGSTSVPEAEWPSWAAARLGPMVDCASIRIERMPTVRGKRSDGNNPTTRRIAVRVTGARVLDADVLAHRWTRGLGHALSYGCGLIITRTAA